MKTIEIKLFSFQELSKEAKEKAIENYKEARESDSYFWDNDAIKSLQKFAEHFGAELKDYGIDFFDGSPSYAKFEVPDEAPTKKELKALIIGMGTYNKKTLRGDGECKFTGYCMDESAADGARKAFFAGETDLNEILKAGYDQWLKDSQQDAEHQKSDEYAAQEMSDNDQEFTEEGEEFNA